MFKLPSKITLYIIIALVVIGLLVFIYFMGRRSGKIKIEQVDLPQDQPGGQNISSQDSAEIISVANQLHEEMKGLNLFRDLEPYQKFLAMSDTLFVATYNRFNQLYAQENDGTLREWINDESGGSWNWQFEEIRKAIILRMDRLNLR